MSRTARLVRRTLTIGGLGVVVLLLVVTLQPRGQLTVTVLDVGQGDAILLEMPDGQDVLVDGGPDGRVLEGLGRALPFYDRTIELMVLTHPHADHVTGFIAALDRYEVERVLTAETLHDSSTYKEWQHAVAAEGSSVDVAITGARFAFGEATLTVLWPAPGSAPSKNLNDDSIVLLLDYRDTEFLFMGDASTEVEQQMLDAVPDVDVLKVGHHGSRFSSSDAFLDRAKPEIAVISVGEGNRYGHPHKEALERLERHGMRVFRTDEYSDIELRSDGSKIRIRTRNR